MRPRIVSFRVQRRITIVGGGVAGLTLGLLLRREGVPVELWEAGQYPRHRVCGEFLSGRGRSVLEEFIRMIPARKASTVRFISRGKASRSLPLPAPALCVTRHALDDSLVRTFVEQGGILRGGARFTGTFAEGVVRATGRRLEMTARSFNGFKFHVRELALGADLELFFSPNGYAGICGLADGSANVCGLFRDRPGFSKMNPRDAFEPIVGTRLETASVDPSSVVGVAGISFRLPAWQRMSEFSLGDSLAIIPPLTGNGMSLAAESASLAAPILRDYSAGIVSWSDALRNFSHVCKKRFAARLRFSSFLQNALSRHSGSTTLLSCLETAPFLLRILFNFTR